MCSKIYPNICSENVSKFTRSMKFQTIAPDQITRSSGERKKYCFLGLQPGKSSDTPTCREKLISYYFLRFKHRQGAIVTRRVAGKCLYFSRCSEESWETWEKSFRSRRHESATLFSLLPFSLSFPPVFPLTTVGFLLVMKSGGQIKQTVVPLSPDDADDAKTRALRRR